MSRLKKKENIVDLLVVGTGFSSLSFIDSYLKRKKKVNVVSPSLNTKRVRHDNKRNLNNHIFKILPPQMSGTEEKVKIAKLAQIISRFFNRKIVIRKKKIKKGSTKNRCPNILKLKKLGFKKKYNLRSGLYKTINWYRKNYR